jgi:hypothetical protein
MVNAWCADRHVIGHKKDICADCQICKGGGHGVGNCERSKANGIKKPKASKGAAYNKNFCNWCRFIHAEGDGCNWKAKVLAAKYDRESVEDEF